MKQIHLIAAVAALSLASMFGLAASAPAPAAAATAPAHASAPSAAARALSAGLPVSALFSHGSVGNTIAPSAAPVSCPNWWCIYQRPNYAVPAGTFYCTGVTNATDTSCRNLDESFANYANDCGPSPNSGCTVRLFYHPLNVANGGAWACIDYARGIPNLSGYTFNNGIGLPGYGAPVWRDAAGVRVSSGTCSHPIGPGL